MTWVFTPLIVSLPIACHQEQSASQSSWAADWNPQTHWPVVSLIARSEAAQRSGPGSQALLYGSLLLVVTNARPAVGPVPRSQDEPQPAAVDPVDPPPVAAAHAGVWLRSAQSL